MKKVVFLDHTAELSGGELAMLRLVEALGDGVEAEVWLAEDGPLVEQLVSRGITVRVYPLAGDVAKADRGSVGIAQLLSSAVRAKRIVLYSRQLSGELKESGASVVHCNSLKAGLYGCLASRIARVPVIWHVRDRLARDYMPRVLIYILRLCLAILPNWVVSNSKSTESTLRLPPWKRRTVVPSPLSASTLSRGREYARARDIGDCEDSFRFAMVGRLAPWKGQHIALGAFSHCAAVVDREIHLHLIGSAMFGEDEYASALVDLAHASASADNVHFHGFESDIPGVLQNMDALIHASISPEPFGQVVAEGLAMGLPVIASNAGGVVEILTDEVDGLLTPMGDPAALAIAMRRIVSDPGLRIRLSAAALQRADDFSADVVATAVRDVYSSATTDVGRWWSVRDSRRFSSFRKS